jgi:hypothetical protein
MRILNVVLGGVVEAILLPFRHLPSVVGLAVVSLLTAIAMLLVFRVTSNQEGLKRVKRQISAGVFEIRLLSDDPRSVVRAQWDILRHTGTYLRLNLVPLAWMIVPLVLLIIQLQFHYGYEGLDPGAVTIVKVTVSESVAQPPPDLSLHESPAIRVESPRLWIPSKREADWRIAATAPGVHELHVSVGGETFTKALHVSGSGARLSPVRPSGLWRQIVYPVESPLPRSGPIASIAVIYPEQRIRVAGFAVHWIIVFFVLTMSFALGLQRPFKVSI